MQALWEALHGGKVTFASSFSVQHADTRHHCPAALNPRLQEKSYSPIHARSRANQPGRVGSKKHPPPVTWPHI